VCCALCNLFFISKWQISKKCVCVCVFVCAHAACASTKFCFKLGKTATEIYEMLKFASGEIISTTQTFDWFCNFRSGVTLVNYNDVHPWVKHNSRNLFMKTDGSLSRTWLMRWDSYLSHAKILWHMIWTCTEFMPCMLQRDPRFHSKVFTGSETWVYGYSS
jgi:hypothetical protein